MIRFTCLLLSFISCICQAQEVPAARPSPLVIVSAHYKDSYLKINYGQPHKNGREIFGRIIPYDHIWRTGANEGTELTVTQDIIINGSVLKAGTYSLFTIPGKDKWVVIINSDLGLWGSVNYNPHKDVMRFEVWVDKLKDIIFEPFTIRIDQKNEKADIVLLWDDTKVSFPIQFNEPKQ